MTISPMMLMTLLLPVPPRPQTTCKYEIGFKVGPSFSPIFDSRREEIRRECIKSEQRRRDELRDGYHHLKDALPISNQKLSKVFLLDRATIHIKYLEMTQQQLQTRLQQAENETVRLCQYVYLSRYPNIELTLLRSINETGDATATTMTMRW
jgi:hypothetical protein